MSKQREFEVIDFIKNAGESSSKEVFEALSSSASYATIKRIITKLISENYLLAVGKGKGTKYIISPVFEMIEPIDIETYFEKEIDEREIKEQFNLQLISDVLKNNLLFSCKKKFFGERR